MLLPFIPGNIYNRRADIHAKYGGNWRGGITPSSTYPYIFIFSGQSGTQHGYKDGWDNHNVFSYTGEGQSGDMKFIRGNLALRDTLINGKRVFLFEFHKKGFVKFNCELELFDFDYFETHDSFNKQRQAIRFFFKRKGTFLDIEPLDLNPQNIAAEERLPYHVNFPNITERQGLVISRVGQGAYRKSILHRWHYKCAVTGFDKIQILIASHIVSWKDSSDFERHDVNNGILLSPTYDALFDRSLISFDDQGKIILSTTIERNAYNQIGVSGKESIQNLNSENRIYLEKHLANFTRLNKLD